MDNLKEVVERDSGVLKLWSKNTGEWAGAPCPICRGGTRDIFHVQPDYPGGSLADGTPRPPGRWLCGNCTNRRWQNAIDYIMRRDSCSFKEALEAWGIKGNHAARPAVASMLAVPPVIEAPSVEWQIKARELAAESEARLWSGNLSAQNALSWLHERGLTDSTIGSARLGYNDEWRYGAPPGLVIPCFIRGELWRVKVRRSNAELAAYPDRAKYGQMTGGSAWALYGVDSLRSDHPVMLVEGELNALTVSQAANDLVDVVATGPAHGCQATKWLARLSLAPAVMVSLDNDMAGHRAAEWWLKALGKRAKRWTPQRKDPADILKLDGSDRLRQWIIEGLGGNDARANHRGDCGGLVVLQMSKE